MLKTLNQKPRRDYNKLYDTSDTGAASSSSGGFSAGPDASPVGRNIASVIKRAARSSCSSVLRISLESSEVNVFRALSTAPLTNSWSSVLNIQPNSAKERTVF